MMLACRPAGTVTQLAARMDIAGRLAAIMESGAGPLFMMELVPGISALPATSATSTWHVVLADVIAVAAVARGYMGGVLF